jgi:phosphatidate phosphatase APP1
MAKTIVALLAMLLPSVVFGADPVSNLKSDEVVEFFPTYCRYDPAAREQTVTVHGWVYEPATNSATARLFWSALGLDAEQAQNRIFQERANRFLVDSERGKRMVVRLAGQEQTLSRTEANGHTQTTFRIAELPPEATRRIDFQAVLPARDKRKFAGHVHAIPPTGASVISDIDDTIKISQVRDKPALLNNTFFKEFEAVSGMEKVYQAWAKDGAAFHYVSASPWQLFEPLESFRERAGFPAGTFHMKHFRLKDSTAWSLFESPIDYKPKVIEPILKDFPKRRFILVGDSGEKDPEVYGGLARKFPDQIAKIFIRDVTGEPAEAARYAEAFKDVPHRRWVIFRKPEEIAGFRP